MCAEFAHSISPALDGPALAQAIRRRGAELGFDLVGIAPAEPSPRADYLRRWLDSGRGGSMDWLARRFDERADPRRYLPGARSVICVAMNYAPPPSAIAADDESAGPRGRIARYALGDDYHELIKSRLHALADWLRERAPDAQTRACVDTGPVLEKELAARAGIGWIGKNTCLIDAGIGSWLLLGEILTTLDLPADVAGEDHCGSCTRCLDACPTGALVGPHELDATRCISYLTIEHRGEIAGELQRAIGDWLYGCDVCQEVCPHNRRAPGTTEPALASRFPGASLPVRQVLDWSEADYRSALKHSAMRRVKLPMLKRNARIVEANAQAAPAPFDPGPGGDQETPID